MMVYIMKDMDLDCILIKTPFPSLGLSVLFLVCAMFVSDLFLYHFISVPCCRVNKPSYSLSFNDTKNGTSS